MESPCWGQEVVVVVGASVGRSEVSSARRDGKAPKAGEGDCFGLMCSVGHKGPSDGADTVSPGRCQCFNLKVGEGSGVRIWLRAGGGRGRPRSL